MASAIRGVLPMHALGAKISMTVFTGAKDDDAHAEVKAPQKWFSTRRNDEHRLEESQRHDVRWLQENHHLSIPIRSLFGPSHTSASIRTRPPRLRSCGRQDGGHLRLKLFARWARYPGGVRRNHLWQCAKTDHPRTLAQAPRPRSRLWRNGIKARVFGPGRQRHKTADSWGDIRADVAATCGGDRNRMAYHEGPRRGGGGARGCGTRRNVERVRSRRQSCDRCPGLKTTARNGRPNMETVGRDIPAALAGDAANGHPTTRP